MKLNSKESVAFSCQV